VEQVDIQLSLVTQIYVRNCVHVYLHTYNKHGTANKANKA